MTLRRTLLVSTGVAAAAILALLLQDVIRRSVVTPLAYLSWVFKLLISTIPQLFIWILLLVVLILFIIASLVNWIPLRKSRQKASPQTIGPVENLAGWVQKKSEGNYYKWKIANRLGNLAREISSRHGNWRRTEKHRESDALDQSLQESVQRYLDAGLEESFVNYPLPPLPFMRKSATPFDLDVELVVDFLEDQMEAFSGQKHL
jgi:hypothetical protein